MTKSAYVCTVITGTVLLFFTVHVAAVGDISTPVSLDSMADIRIADRIILYPEGGFSTGTSVPVDIGSSGDNAREGGNGQGGGSGNDGIGGATVDAGMADEKTIYTLADADWGYNGDPGFCVTANYQNGESSTWLYKEGRQPRDRNLNPAFATTIDRTDTNEVSGISSPLPVFDPETSDVLDIQTIDISEPDQSITLETLVPTDDSETAVDSALLLGVAASDNGPVTYSLKSHCPVPIPASFSLFAWAVAAAGFMRCRRKII